MLYMFTLDLTSSRQPCVHEVSDLENALMLHTMRVIPIPAPSSVSLLISEEYANKRRACPSLVLAALRILKPPVTSTVVTVYD